ncbi:hypothetical protein EF888_09720 [Silicimonas algicola]|uniref:Uncharacterized protein n=1 Tax=Silicimonas algicola TaxID=1826607 RepID=A0A316G810_9RHOB|nr:hypothetical protein [Silicimonas algicola]AZQ67382.1 hypothetical protein EF888_09720 [Silicimonas algicola]PWK57064.1 hypothetical protein C8D95_103302 [Silicimonas algicola]
MKRLIMASAIALTAAMPAFAQDRVQEVDVTFDIEAVQSRDAASFWSNLSGDLETAILERVSDRIAEDDGYEILIDVNEVDMSNSFQSALGKDSTIVAGVRMKNEDMTKEEYYNLTVRLEEAGNFEFMPDGALVQTVPVEEAYAAMIDAFADNVVTHLD